MNSSIKQSTAIFIVSTLSVSCINKKIETRLNHHEIGQTIQLHELVRSSKNSKQKSIIWAQAVKRVESSNLHYRTSLEEIVQAKRSIKKTWWSLAPDIFTFASITKNISDISDISTSDISFSVAGNLNIPNPFIFYAQLYGNHLNILRAEWQHELTRRNLHSQLYRAYISSESITASKLALFKKKHLINTLPPDKIASEFASIREGEHTISLQQEFLRLQLNRLFNSPGENWRLTDTPPNISYSKKLKKLDLRNGFGKLGLMLQTIQIEVAELSLWQVNFNRFPQFNIGVSTPPLLTNDSSGTTTFDPERINLFSGASRNFDLSDPLSLEIIRDSQIRSKHTREQLILTTESEISHLQQLKQQYRNLLQQESNLMKLRRQQSKSKLSTDPTLLLKQLKSQGEMKEQLQKNKQAQQTIDLQFWLWDENYWRKFN